jgi:hypothetical protein
MEFTRMKALKTDPEFVAVQERLDKIGRRIGELKTTKETILGRMSDAQRAARERTKDRAAEQVWKSGSFDPVNTELDQKLRQNLKVIDNELEILDKARLIGEREQLDIRTRRSQEASAEHRGDYQKLVEATVRASIDHALAIRAEQDFLSRFAAAGLAPCFNRVSPTNGQYDLSSSSSVPSRLVAAAISGGWLSGKESWIKGVVNWDGNLRSKK